MNNHMVDVAFTIVTQKEIGDITKDEFLAALGRRLADLKDDPGAVEAFGLCDTYVEE